MKRLFELRYVIMEMYFEGGLVELIEELMESPLDSMKLKFGEILTDDVIGKIEAITNDGSYVLIEMTYSNYAKGEPAAMSHEFAKSRNVKTCFENVLMKQGIDRWIKIKLTDESDSVEGNPHKIARVVTLGGGTLDDQITIMENHIIDVSRWSFEENEKLKGWFKWLSKDSHANYEEVVRTGPYYCTDVPWSA